MLVSIETRDDGEHDSTVKNMARISVAITAACGELRQHAKAAVREVSKIPLDTVITYLKTLRPEQREDIARELTGADADEPLL